MSYALQIIEQDALPLQGISQAMPATINQNGYQSTMIGHVENLNLTVSSLPMLSGNNMPYRPARISNNYFNLFVVGSEEFNQNYFTVPKDRALTESINPNIKKQYARLNDIAIENIKTFPSIFASENRRCAATDVDHQAYCGFVTDIQLRPNDIRVTYRLIFSIPQQRLNEIAADLLLGQAPLANELNDTHWTIKQINLLDRLRTAGICVPVSA